MATLFKDKPVKPNSDTNLPQYWKQQKRLHAKPKQFSAKSRSKSNVSFKNLQKLHKVSSHDTLNRAILDPIKKSKSSESLNRLKVHSGLSMTALVRTNSHPVFLHQHPRLSKGKWLGKDRQQKAVILDLHDSGDNDSFTDEEVESFTNDDVISEQHIDGLVEQMSSDLRPEMTQRDSIQSMHEFQDRGSLQLNGKRSAQKPLSYKPPSRLRNRVYADDDHISSKGELSNTDDEIGSHAPDDLIDSNNQDNSSGTNSLRRHRHNMFGLVESNPNSQRSELESPIGEVNPNNDAEDSSPNDDDKQNNSARSIEVNPDQLDGTVDAVMSSQHKESAAESFINDSKPHVPEEQISSLAQGSETVGNSEDDQSPGVTSIDAEAQDTERYLPDMILSQSTGMERRFDQLSRLSSTASVNPSGNNNKNITIQEVDSNKFHYINQDFAASLKEEGIDQGAAQQAQQSKTPKVDFSTSISSLTSHLTRPISRDHIPRLNALQSKSGQQSLYRQSSFEESAPNNNVTDFSSFLQYGDVGADSRTQQKLWLQRENSIQDLTSHNAIPDSVFLASNVEVRREFERISREYTNVRRFTNPLVESLSRISRQDTIDIHKHKKANAPDVVGSVFSLDYGKSKQNKESFSPNSKLEIQRTLGKIWNNNTIEFNKDENPLIQTGSELLSTQSSNVHRNNRGSRVSNSQHQRAVNTLHPTTRAVNRRMEHVMSQQRI